MPALDKWLAKNPRLASKFPAFAVTAGFCVERFMERMQALDQFKGKTDFMNHFLAAKEEHPTVVTDNEVIAYMIINVLGGGDTTSITIKAIIYHALKNPAVHKRLVEELKNTNLSYPAPFSSLEGLSYLDACIKEGLRIHPVVGHIMERIVPSTGLALNNGVTLPPGTIVGVNPWVVHRRAEVYGERPDEFLPERWLKKAGEGDAEYEARLKRMNDADLSFGKGNRVCLGRPLALVEMAKIVGTLFAKYQVSFSHLPRRGCNGVDADWLACRSSSRIPRRCGRCTRSGSCGRTRSASNFQSTERAAHWSGSPCLSMSMSFIVLRCEWGSGLGGGVHHFVQNAVIGFSFSSAFVRCVYMSGGRCVSSSYTK